MSADTDTDIGILGIPGEPVAPQRSESSPVDGTEEDDGDPPDDVGPQAPRPARHRNRRRRRHPRARRYCKRAVLVIAVLMIPVAYSYGRALTGPGSDSLQARSVEWARENHLGWVVDRVETYWYAHHQAQVGGAPDTRAGQLAIEPAAASAGQTASTAVAADSSLPGSTAPVSASPVDTRPGVVASPAQPSSPGAATTPGTQLPGNPPTTLVSPAADKVAQEGVWTGIGTASNGRYGAYATLIRPDAVHTSVLDAVVWIDPTMLSLRQYPGQKIPGAPWDRPDSIEPQRQPRLLAAFEGGFRLADSKGGMFLGGTTLSPLRAGGAAFVIDRNGVPAIGVWGRDFTSTDGLDSVRQNLDLIVDGGVVSSRLATDPNRSWGFTGPANKDAVWRSGAGITADGALVWVGGNGLSIVALANTLLRAGAVRAMQLDINHEWVQFNTYAGDGSGSVHGSRLLTDMQHSGDRYLSEDTRDFIAVFRRSN